MQGSGTREDPMDVDLEDGGDAPSHHSDGGPPDDDSPDPSEPGSDGSWSDLDANPRSKHDLARAINRLAKSSKPKSDSSGRSHARKPDPFDGTDPFKLKTFLFQCNIFFKCNYRSFRHPGSRTVFALSYLKGTALSYFENSMAEGVDEPWLDDWAEFKKILEVNFGVIDPKGNASIRFDRLRMSEGQKILKYNVEFNRLSSEVKWDEEALYHRYYSGLADRIKDTLALREKPKTLRLLREAAQLLDGRHWERHVESQRSDKNSSSRDKSDHKGKSKDKKNRQSDKKQSDNKSKSNSSNSNSNNNNNNKSGSSSSRPDKKTPDLSDVLGKDGKLKPEERQRRLEKNLCLRCGSSGHMADACTKGKTTSKARATTTTTTESTNSESSDSKN